MMLLSLTKVILIFLMVNPAFAVTELEGEYYSQLPMLQEKFAPIEELKAALVLQKQNIVELLKRLNEKADQLSADGLDDSEIKTRLKKEIDEINEAKQKHAEIGKTFKSLEGNYRDEFLRPLIDRYSWAIPNEDALETIAKYSPIIEIGAGSGYWAHLLTQRNPEIELVAYDDFSWEDREHHRIEKTWFNVQKGDFFSQLDVKHKKKNLFLCWPPINVVAFMTLLNFSGDYVIYVGETPEGLKEKGLPFSPAHADENFFNFLKNDFDKVTEVAIPNWPGYTDKLYIYKRKVSCTPYVFVAIDIPQIEESLNSPSICNRLQSYISWFGEFLIYPVKKLKLN